MKFSKTIFLLFLSVLFLTGCGCRQSEGQLIVCNNNISGTIWEDADKDGIMADDEDRVAGAEVQLLNSDGEIIDAYVTKSSGVYEFTGVDKSAEIKVILPPDKAFTEQGSREVSNASHVDEGGFSGLIVGETCTDSFTINAGLISTMEETEEDDIAATPTNTPIPEGTDCGSVDVPITKVEEYTSDSGLTIKVNLILRGAENDWIGYLPWVNGDGTDWENELDMYFEGEPINVMSLTYPGCEGGCRAWKPEIWYDAVGFFTTLFVDHPCFAPEANVTLWGVSIGELALTFCPQMPNCRMAIVFSAGGYFGSPLQAELDGMISAGLPAYIVWGEIDPEMSFLNTYASGLSWINAFGFSQAAKDVLTFLRLDGSDAHGNDLFKEDLLLFLKARIIEDYKE